MRLVKTLMVVGALAIATGSAFAQATPPAQPPAKPTTPAPAPPATPAPAAEAPRPYPEGAKIAYVSLQMVAQSSAEGKTATGRIQEMEKKKIAEIQAKNKQLEDARTKAQTSSNLLNDTARLSIEKEVDKLTREVQFMQQEAQAERNQLQTELQVEFQRKLNPIIEQITKEKNLHMLLDFDASGVIWADPALDLTGEVIKRLDAANAKGAAPAKK